MARWICTGGRYIMPCGLMLCNSTVWHDISWAGHRVGVPAHSPLSVNNPTPTLQQLHQKALNPWDAHSPSLFRFSRSATRLLSSLCRSAAAAGLLLGPTKNNGIATGNGDDDEWGGGWEEEGGYFAEWLGVVDSRTAFLMCLCMWKRLMLLRKLSWSQTVNSRAGGLWPRGEFEGLSR